MNWIHTHSGVRFNLDAPTPEMVKIGDIAYALSHLNRFCGHAGSYSVAQHSWLVSHECPGHELWGLLHDAAEAYLNDVSSPAKQAMRRASRPSPFDVLECRVMKVVTERFRLSMPTPLCVKVADNRALSTERRDLFGDQRTRDWHHVPANGHEPFTPRIQVQEPARAEELFLKRFVEVF